MVIVIVVTISLKFDISLNSKCILKQYNFLLKDMLITHNIYTHTHARRFVMLIQINYGKSNKLLHNYCVKYINIEFLILFSE